MSKKLLLILVIFMIYQVFIYGNLSGLSITSKEIIRKINFAPFYPLGSHISKMDILTNVIFFFIFGVVFFYAFAQKRKFSILIFAMAAISGMVLAGSVEFAELFMDSRVASLFDVILALFGTVLGYLTGLLSYLSSNGSPGTKIRNILINRPLYFFVLAYAFFLFLEAAFPFDFSLQVSDVWRNIKSLRLMLPARLNILELFFSHKMLLFSILGFFLHRSLMQYTNSGKVRTLLNSFLAGLIFAVITEGIQLFVVSGSPRMVDIIIKCLGLASGILASLFAKKDYQIYFGYAFILLVYFLYPFQLDLSGIKTKLDIGSLIPFRIQLTATNTNVFNDFIHTCLLFLPAGFSLYIKRSKLGYSSTGLPRLFLTGLLIGFVIEIMQLFINGRVAEITDALYAGLGCLLGGYLCKMALELQKLHPAR